MPQKGNKESEETSGGDVRETGVEEEAEKRATPSSDAKAEICGDPKTKKKLFNDSSSRYSVSCPLSLKILCIV